MVHALLLATSLVAVQSPDTGRKLHGAGDAGFVSTSGNTSVTSVNVGEKLELKAGHWKFGQGLAFLYGRTDGVTSARQWRGSLRGERGVFHGGSLFLLGEWERNLFAGLRSRIVQTAGLSLRVVDREKNKLVTDLGAGYTWQANVAPEPDRDFAVGRAAMRYTHKFGTKSSFDEVIEYFPSFKIGADYHLNSESVLSAPITRSIAIKVGYAWRYTGLPQPGFKKGDQIFTSGIQATF